MRPAIFFDRDGVLIRDVDLMTAVEDIELLEGAPRAVAMARAAGFATIVVTNQTVVARGLCSEDDVARVNRAIGAALHETGGAAIDRFMVCPHHPNATDPAYRRVCECRKPQPGMLLAAARELGLDLAASWLLGDRPTDILAGQRAGCRTVLIRSEMSAAPLLGGVNADELVAPEFEAECALAALERILAS